jgi:hypothetical protein
MLLSPGNPRYDDDSLQEVRRVDEVRLSHLRCEETEEIQLTYTSVGPQTPHSCPSRDISYPRYSTLPRRLDPHHTDTHEIPTNAKCIQDCAFSGRRTTSNTNSVG